MPESFYSFIQTMTESLPSRHCPSLQGLRARQGLEVRSLRWQKSWLKTKQKTTKKVIPQKGQKVIRPGDLKHRGREKAMHDGAQDPASGHVEKHLEGTFFSCCYIERRLWVGGRHWRKEAIRQVGDVKEA